MKKNDLIVNGVVYLVLGILLCIGVSGNDMIGYLLSVSMLVGAAVLIVANIIQTKSVLGNFGLAGGILLTLGLALFPPIALFKSYFEVISLAMIVIGALFIADSILGFANKRNTVGYIIILIIGALLFTFGMLLWFNVGDMRRFASLILGIVFIIYAVLLLISALTGKDLVGVTERKKK